jgi:hypothetical protein
MKSKTRKELIKARYREAEFLATAAATGPSAPMVDRGALMRAFDGFRRKDGGKQRFDTWDLARQQGGTGN